jgi:uncharacterized protein
MADNTQFVRDAFDTFNKADIDGLSKIIADDAVQHMRGSNQLAGDHNGRDNILAMYGKIGELTGGTFQAVLTDAKDDGPDKVVGQYNGQATRDDKTLDSKNTIAFTLRDGQIVDIDDQPSDLAAWDDFWG